MAVALLSTPTYLGEKKTLKVNFKTNFFFNSIWHSTHSNNNYSGPVFEHQK